MFDQIVIKTILLLITIVFYTLVLAGCGPTTQQTTRPTRALLQPTVTVTPLPLPTATLTRAPSPTPAAPVKGEEPPSTATSSSVDMAAVDLAQGIDIYHQNYCGVCHTLTVADTRGTFAPNQDNMGAVAAERVRDPGYKGSATTAEEYLLESLVDPQAHVVDGYELTRHKMPAFSHLDDDTLQTLVQMLLLQK